MKQEDIKNMLESLSPAIEAIADPNIKMIISQLLFIISEQQKIIKEQRQTIETLEEKLKTNSKNSSTPPSADGFKKEKNQPAKNKKKGKKRKQGGQMGLQLHKGMKSFVWLIFLGMRVYLGTRICYSLWSF